MSWDITVPAGSESASQGDDRIREFKSDLQDALQGQDVSGVEAVFPGVDTANPVYRYRGLRGTTAARPAPGDYGLYANTTLNTLQRDNGASWADIATLIPSGTVMCFFQAAVPTGWTQVTTQNDKVLRVVSSAGGGSGGTIGTSSSLAHDHTHTHPIPHRHVSPVGNNGTTVYIALSTSGAWGQGTESKTADIHAGAIAGAAGQTVLFTKTQDTDTSNSGTSSSDSKLGVLAYADVILGSKD